jgi:hypothetical protein
MSDFGALNELVALQRSREHATTRTLHNPSTRHRPRGRHALAHRLHALADRLDG